MYFPDASSEASTRTGFPEYRPATESAAITSAAAPSPDGQQ